MVVALNTVSFTFFIVLVAIYSRRVANYALTMLFQLEKPALLPVLPFLI